ncbi:SRPBCC family protein [Luteococcus peritonei]|uniref:SRPBCC family protein n=1 Tax=Luteococcus peritonei TaxID=88874 RepID=A0ABW4RRA0_9ACTN
MADNENVTVSRVIDAPAKDIYEFLTLPRNHVALDGSDMVRGAVNGDQRLSAVGDVFTMDMYADSQGGDYQRDNHVSGLVENKVVAWKPAKPGEQPGGWEWVYTLEPQGSEATEVTLSYDWSEVTDAKLKARFPMIPKEALEASLGNLAQAVSEK